MSINRMRLCLAVLLSMVACLSGCIEVEQRIRLRDDGSLSLKATVKIEPQYEAMVLPAMRNEMPKKVPTGARIDFSQRIDGKAAIVIDADGAAAAQMVKEDGSVVTSVSDGGFMKKRYEYRAMVRRAPEVPFPHRVVVSLPGSIESLTGGTKTASDTVEFDMTHAKSGQLFAVTSTAFAFSLGGGGVPATEVKDAGMAAWLIPVSVGSIGVGAALLLAGWFRVRQAKRVVGVSAIVAAPVFSERVPNAVEEAASMFCTECGARNAANRKFCGQCGHALG